jgi:CTP synthase
MRLGAYRCRLKQPSLARRAYGAVEISERHRHRYEVNNDYLDTLKSHGLRIGGVNPETGLVEVIELGDHPWFVAVQYHPELKSRALAAHPLFRDFVNASLEYKRSKQDSLDEDD